MPTRQKHSTRLYLTLVFLAAFLWGFGQDSTLYKILFIGHAFGSQDTTVPQWNSLIENKARLQDPSIQSVFFLGDLTRDPLLSTSEEMSKTMRKVFYKNDCSFFYVEGNHDVLHKNYFRGSCCFSQNTHNFIIISNPAFPYLIIFLNSENYKELTDSKIKKIVDNTSCKNVVFLSHRLIWAYSNPRYKHLVELTNSPKMHKLPQVVDFDFLNAQKDKKFYFFAGDLGVNIPLFYDKVGNVTMYATGCGGTDKDNALLAEFKRDTIITSLVHLGSANYNIDDYTLDKINAIQPETKNPTQTYNLPSTWQYKALILGLFVGLMALVLSILFNKI